MFECNQGWMYGGGWMLFGWLWMVLLMLAPVLLVAALVKYVFGGWGEDADQTCGAGHPE